MPIRFDELSGRINQFVCYPRAFLKLVIEGSFSNFAPQGDARARAEGPPAAPDQCSGGFRIHPREGDVSVLRRQRPALAPVVMFKLLFIGYLLGVRSEGN